METHGFTHHQKTAIVDRIGSDGRRHLVVFTGGLDITQRMTDASDHPLDGWRGSAPLSLRRVAASEDCYGGSQGSSQAARGCRDVRQVSLT